MKIVKTETEDGIVLNGLISESNKNKKIIIIHVHGMAGSIVLEDFYQTMHNQYPKNGIAFLAGENRGLGVVTPFMTRDGKLKTMGSAFEKFEDSHSDIKSWIDFSISLGYTEVWLQGHSLGCTKIAYYLHKYKIENIAGVIFLSPSPILGLGNKLKGKEMVEKAKKLMLEDRGDTLLSDSDWGPVLLSAKTIVNLFGERSELGIFNFSDEKLEHNIINKIDVPVIAFTGTKDTGIVLINDPYVAMKKLEGELRKSPRIKTIVFVNGRHLFQGFGEKIVKEVLDFIG